MEKIELMKVMAQVYCAGLKASKAPNFGLKKLEAKSAVDDFINMIDEKIK